jgi:hypothetical protein
MPAKKKVDEAKKAEEKEIEDLKQKFIKAVKSDSTTATGEAAKDIDFYNHSGRGQIKFSKTEISELLKDIKNSKKIDLFKNRLTGNTRYIFITPSRKGGKKTLRKTRGHRMSTRKNGFKGGSNPTCY